MYHLSVIALLVSGTVEYLVICKIKNLTVLIYCIKNKGPTVGIVQ